MSFNGLIAGAVFFVCIGLCHPAVVKMEYYWGKRSWWVWLVVGLICCVASVMVKNQILSAFLGTFAFSCFWGITEMIHQEERVVKGWFPENPKRHDYYESLRHRD